MLDNNFLDDYIICSSHNTYLSGTQIIGNSNVEEYFKTLDELGRCVELDVYYDNDKKLFTIKHYGTLTGQINLVDVLKKINEYINLNRICYPIILNLETHCGKSCNNLHDILKLNIKNIGFTCFIGTNCIRKKKLEELFNTIIIRDKLENIGDDLVGLSKSKLNIYNPPNCWCTTSSYSNTDLLKLLEIKNIAKSYYKINNIDQCIKFMELSKLTMIRTYPSGNKVLSGNYDTILMMSLGVSMPAINFQNNDRYKRIMAILFEQNKTGYLKKPSYLLKEKVIIPNSFYELSIKLDSNIRSCSLYADIFTLYKFNMPTNFYVRNPNRNIVFNVCCLDISVLYIKYSETEFACLPLMQLKYGTNMYQIYVYKSEYISNEQNTYFGKLRKMFALNIEITCTIK